MKVVFFKTSGTLSIYFLSSLGPLAPTCEILAEMPYCRTCEADLVYPVGAGRWGSQRAYFQKHARLFLSASKCSWAELPARYSASAISPRRSIDQSLHDELICCHSSTT
eukprot:25125_1